MRVVPIMNHFLGGEVSRRLYGRTDLDIYKSSAKTLENVFVLPQGGVRRRDGTLYVADAKSTATKSRLIEFESSYGDWYIIELAHQVIRFYRASDHTQIVSGTPVEVASPYDSADLFELMVAQDHDDLWIFHRDYQTRYLHFASATSWTLTLMKPNDGPWMERNETAGSTLTLSGGSTWAAGETGLTLTATGHTPFASTHVGGLWHLKIGTDETYVEVTAYTSSTVVTVTARAAVPAALQAAAVSDWAEGAWSDYRGWPGAGTFYQQRLVVGGNDRSPHTIWASAIGDPLDHDAGALADDALSYEVKARRRQDVRWFAVVDGALVMGSQTSEWVLCRPDEVFTPSTVRADEHTRIGSALVQPLELHDTVVFVHTNGRNVYQMRLDRDSRQPAYLSNDLTLSFVEQTEGGIVQLARTLGTDRQLFAVRGDGVLLACQWVPGVGIAGWTRCTTAGTFESIAVCGCSDAWVAVKRTIDGTVARFVEYLSSSAHVDAGVIGSGGPFTTLTGLGHLDGEEVDVRADRATLPAKTPALGSISLGATYDAVQAGLGFSFTVTPLPLVDGNPRGTGVGRRRRTFEVTLLLDGTTAAKVNGRPLVLRGATVPMGEGPEPFTGEHTVTIEASHFDDGTFTISGTEPQPFGLSAVAYVLETGGA